MTKKGRDIKKKANIRIQKSYSNIRNEYDYSNIRISVDILSFNSHISFVIKKKNKQVICARCVRCVLFNDMICFYFSNLNAFDKLLVPFYIYFPTEQNVMLYASFSVI